ncbi:hypothetical protein B5F35_15800 [Anaeromassilibacillus sp. An200]|nr:hypothetical protein B5F35_15800 [Anaeromassilibacillus sp. An200]
MKLNLHPKGIPKQEPLGADTPLKKGGVVVGMRQGGTDQYASGTPARKQQTNLRPCGREKRVSLLGSKPYR